MNRVLFTLILLLSSAGSAFSIIILPSVTQTQYRWRNDDGDQATATWQAAANTPINLTNASLTQRLRLELRNTSGATMGIDQNLEYSSDNGATWTTINNSASNEFWYEPSTLVANGTVTTNQLGTATAGTYVAGMVVSAPAAAVNLATASRTEYEWVIKPTANIQAFKTYIFRSANQGATPLNYGELSTGCVGEIVSGNIAVDMPVLNCHESTNLTLAGHTEGAVNFQWQMNNGSGWQNLGANADNLATPQLIQNTDFRCIVSCVASAANADTSAAVTVISLPLPVDLGADRNECISEEGFVLLDAGVFPGTIQYAWSDGSTAQVNVVTSSGVYVVNVTDQNNCQGTDTIKVTVRDNPVVTLGNDTTICNQGSLTLDAGTDGIDYYWNTGATTQTVEVNSPGSYVAIVTNDQGCSMSDTFTLSMSGEFPKIQGITITNNGLRTFYFTAVNPQNVIGFDWDFGDGSPHSFATVPTHTYADDKSYVVVLKMASTCGFRSDSTSVHILGINQLDVDNSQLTVFPNPAKTSVTLANNGHFRMNEIVVYNISGQIIYKQKADSADKHQLQLGHITSGIYTIGVFTDKGVVLRKLDVVK